MDAVKGPTKTNGLIDELVVHDIATLHMERLSDGTVWIGLYDGEGKHISINMFAKHNTLVVETSNG